MDFNSLTEDEVKVLGAIAYPQIDPDTNLDGEREAICEKLAMEGFLDKVKGPQGLVSYRMQMGVHTGFCQWSDEDEDKNTRIILERPDEHQQGHWSDSLEEKLLEIFAEDVKEFRGKTAYLCPYFRGSTISDVIRAIGKLRQGVEVTPGSFDE